MPAENFIATEHQRVSIDYGAAIKETRALTDKYSEVKLQGLFYQASPSLYASTIVGSGGNYTSNTTLFTTQLGNNGLAGSNYYIIRQGANKYVFLTCHQPTEGLLTVRLMLASLRTLTSN